jgi:hypothetical protein
VAFADHHKAVLKGVTREVSMVECHSSKPMDPREAPQRPEVIQI